MEKLQISDISALQPIDLIQIHSLDWMLYQVSISSNNTQKLLYKGQTPYRFHNLLQIKELFETLEVHRYQLIRDNSAYDEMIGQPEALFSDAIAVDLFWKHVITTHH